MTARSWDVLLVGGAAGTGKTRVGRDLARLFGVGLTEVDDLHLVLETLTTPEQQPILHAWKTRPEAARLAPEGIVELHLSVARVLLPGLSAVVANHAETRAPIVLEGDYLLPELLADPGETPWAAERVRAVFLYEPDERRIVRNFLEREPEAGEQASRARVSWLLGMWLRDECERRGLPALPARPWRSLRERVVAAVGP